MAGRGVDGEREAVRPKRGSKRAEYFLVMTITHTSRTGKTYYLHTGPKRGGGVQHFFSTQSAGSLAEHLPEGFEIHESVNGQVFLRRKQPRLIQDEEIACIESGLPKQRGSHRYKVEIRGNTLTIFESVDNFGGLKPIFPWIDAKKEAELRERSAHYQGVVRFVLVDREKRLFAPARFCFRGSVDDWIPIGPPEPVNPLAEKYLKHLGRDSIYELY